MDLFKALSGGLATFLYGWIVPSVVTVGAFALLVFPALRGVTWVEELSVTAAQYSFSALLVFAFSVLALSLVFAITSIPIYRMLEGYALPTAVRERLRARQMRTFSRLKTLAEREWPAHSPIQAGIYEERLLRYPAKLADVLPTRLGNGMKSMETYGARFGVDSQVLWYELNSVTNDRLRRDLDDARASVDFFVSVIAHMLLLALVAAVVAITQSSPAQWVVVLGALLLSMAAYQGAVYNTLDWRFAVQAMVNTCRAGLAEKVGLTTPRYFEDERKMWEAFTRIVREESPPLSSRIEVLDQFRTRS